MPNDNEFRDEGVWGATFVFAIDGKEIGRFNEVSGLEVSLETKEYEEGGQNGYVRTFPGRLKWPNLVFKRGITQNDLLFQWINECSGQGLAKAGNKVARHTGAVVLTDAAGKAVRQWAFEDAMPVRWSGPSLAAGSSDYPEEELEISHSGLRVEAK